MKGKNRRLRYQLFYKKHGTKDQWTKGLKYTCMKDIAKELDLNLSTIFLLYHKKAGTNAKHFKIEYIPKEE